MLDGADEPSSLPVSLSSAAELLKGRIDVVVGNRVRWGTRSALVAAMSHFLDLGTELELLGLGHNVDLAVD
jgi:hypothetical protein